MNRLFKTMVIGVTLAFGGMNIVPDLSNVANAQVAPVKITKKAPKKVVQAPVKKAVKKIATPPTKKAVKKIAKAPTKKAVKKAVGQTARKTAKKVIKKVAPRTTRVEGQGPGRYVFVPTGTSQSSFTPRPASKAGGRYVWVPAAG